MKKPAPEPLREFSIEVVKRLRGAGYHALWAGGCVRDLLLGKEPKDYDVATNARPEQIRELFRRTVAVGESFGVIRVIGGRGVDVEVATFRSDGVYSDGRRPDSVTFCGPELDALRRDFTINGMYFDPLTGEILDLVGGREDIHRRVVRAIGDASQRFAEDKLRMLRAARFRSALGFGLDPSTAEAARRMAEEVAVVSAERIQTELRLMLTPPTRVLAIQTLGSLNLLPVAMPEVARQADWLALEKVLGYWKDTVTWPLAAAALFATHADEDAIGAAREFMSRLKSSNEDSERVLWLVEQRRGFDRPREKRLAHLKRLLAHPGSSQLLDYHEALSAASGAPQDNQAVRDLAARLPSEAIDPPPLVTGDDLIKAGLKPGPAFREILESVRDEQLDGTVTSPAEALRLAMEMAQKKAQ